MDQRFGPINIAAFTSLTSVKHRFELTKEKINEDAETDSASDLRVCGLVTERRFIIRLRSYWSLGDRPIGVQQAIHKEGQQNYV